MGLFDSSCVLLVLRLFNNGWRAQRVRYRSEQKPLSFADMLLYSTRQLFYRNSIKADRLTVPTQPGQTTPASLAVDHGDIQARTFHRTASLRRPLAAVEQCMGHRAREQDTRGNEATYRPRLLRIRYVVVVEQFYVTALRLQKNRRYGRSKLFPYLNTY